MPDAANTKTATKSTARATQDRPQVRGLQPGGAYGDMARLQRLAGNRAVAGLLTGSLPGESAAMPRSMPGGGRKLLAHELAHVIEQSRQGGSQPVAAQEQDAGAAELADVNIQTKSEIDKPGDSFEREADHIAAQVTSMRQPSPSPPCGCGGSCPECKSAAAAPAIQRKAIGGVSAPPSLQGLIGSGGHPLDAETRSFMEPRFGREFSQVRVHTGEAAARSAQAVSAEAFTSGNSIVFNEGRYRPGTPEGKRLLAHELTHVVQQNGSPSAIQRSPARDPHPQQDVSAARRHGQLMAQRIRKHGKLSTEARAKMNRELAYFEGAARDAYIAAVRPILRAVTEIEMPEDFPALPVRRDTSSLLAEDQNICGMPGSVAEGLGRCMTDEKIYEDITRAKEKEQQETRERLAKRLRDMTKGWLPGDRDFTLELLEHEMQASTDLYPKTVHDAIRGPIMKRCEDLLRRIDKEILDKCKTNPPGWREKLSEAVGTGQKLCESWFENPWSHGPNTLTELERSLKLSGGHHDPVDQIYWDMFAYRMLTDPELLREQALISGALQGGAFSIGTPGGRPAPQTPNPAPKQLTAGETPVVPPTGEPLTGPNPNPIQGGGQKTPQRQGHLSSVDPEGNLQTPASKPPTDPRTPSGGAAGQPKPVQAANDNAVPQPQRQVAVKAAGAGATESMASPKPPAVKKPATTGSVRTGPGSPTGGKPPAEPPAESVWVRLESDPHVVKQYSRSDVKGKATAGAKVTTPDGKGTIVPLPPKDAVWVQLGDGRITEFDRSEVNVQGGPKVGSKVKTPEGEGTVLESPPGKEGPTKPLPTEDRPVSGGAKSQPASKFWDGLKPFRGKTKTNGLSGKDLQYYEWDATHSDVEVYDSQGYHLGSANAETGAMTKKAVKGRTIDI